MEFLKKFSKFLLLLVIAAFLGWYIGFLSQVKEVEPLKKTPEENKIISQPVRKFPELRDPKEVDYNWSYKKKDYSIKLTLHKSVYDFYRSSPKEYTYYGELPENWEEDYYGMFLSGNPVDRTVTDLAKNFKDLASKNRLSDDQMVEMIVAFVQSIPYDNAKAKLIEAGSNEIKPIYPYELLFENQGVCSDKSFLLTAVLRELGYGTVLFEFKDEKHIAVGIQCPKELSTYDSSFCYAETTQPGHKIGVVPDLEADNNIALAKKEIGSLDQETQQQANIKKLGAVRLFQQKEGKIYGGINYTIKTIERINTLEADVAALKNELLPIKAQLEKEEKEVEEMESEMNNFKKNKNYESYNKMVPQYNKFLGDYRKATNDYNKKVTTYNQKVNEYNKLIRDFYE